MPEHSDSSAASLPSESPPPQPSAIERLRAKYPEYRRQVQDTLLTPFHNTMEQLLSTGDLYVRVYCSSDQSDMGQRQANFERLVEAANVSEFSREWLQGKSIDEAKGTIDNSFSILANKLRFIPLAIQALDERDNALMHDIAEVRYEDILASMQSAIFDNTNPTISSIPMGKKHAFLDVIRQAHDTPRYTVSIELDKEMETLKKDDEYYALWKQNYHYIDTLSRLSLYSRVLGLLALDSVRNAFEISGQKTRFLDLPEVVRNIITDYGQQESYNFVDGVNVDQFQYIDDSRFAEDIEITNAIFGENALEQMEFQVQRTALLETMQSHIHSPYELLGVIKSAEHPNPTLVLETFLILWNEIRSVSVVSGVDYKKTLIEDFIRVLMKKPQLLALAEMHFMQPILQIIQKHPDTYYLERVVDTTHPIGKSLYKALEKEKWPKESITALLSKTPIEARHTIGLQLPQQLQAALDKLGIEPTQIPLRKSPILVGIEDVLQDACVQVIRQDEEQGNLVSPTVISSFMEKLGSDMHPALREAYHAWPYHTQTPEVLLAHLKLTPDYPTLLDYARHIQTLPTAAREQIQKEIDKGVLSLCITQDTLLPGDIQLLSATTGIPVDQLQDVLPVLRTIHKDDIPIARESLQKTDWMIYVQTARHPQRNAVLHVLSQHHIEYSLTMQQLHTILSTSPEQFTEQIQTISSHNPSFQYHIANYKRYISPYEALVLQKSPQDLFLSFIQDGDSSSFARETTKALYKKITGKQLDDVSAPALVGVFRELAKTIWDAEKVDPVDRSFFGNPHLLSYLARHPEDIGAIIAFPQTHSKYLQLLRPGGILHSNSDTVLENLFSSDDVFAEARRAEFIFTQKRPYWQSLYYFTEQKLDRLLIDADTDYPISYIGRQTFSQLSHSSRLETLISDLDILQQVKHGLQAVPFQALSQQAKHLVFRDYLRRTIETSQEDNAKQAAHQRNTSYISQNSQYFGTTNLQFTPTMRIHGSSVDTLEPMLAYGNLCGEALGSDASADSYPFQVDLSVPDTSEENVQGVLNASISHSYGTGGKLGSDGQIFYLYERKGSTWESNIDYGPSNRLDKHALMFVGIPATEISGIILTNPQATQQIAIKQILSNGFYIPLYDRDGTLLFSPEDYQTLYTDLNMRVPVERIDYSFQLGEQQGSNKGGVFAIPEKRGSVEYYVKFGTTDGHVWNEYLANALYRHAHIPVPNTKVVVLDASLGHASEILPENHAPLLTARNDGALMDMWLANWDVIANSGNMLEGYRVDNGGALLYRAQGEEKSDEFGEQVVEFFSMQHGYPGITHEELRKQAKELERQFPDKVIRELVNSVRLPQSQREFLINTLIKRREYLLKILHQEQHQTEVTPEGQQFIELLIQSELQDDLIVKHIPVWDRLTGENGYQHNGVLLGNHIKDALKHLRAQKLYTQLSPEEQRLALLATFFHDFAKPTGQKDEIVERDYEHEKESARIAATHMARWGFSAYTIAQVQNVIMYDGIVSDIARGKVRDEEKNLNEQQLLRALDNNRSTARLLRLVNAADVLANAHPEQDFWDRFNTFFDRMEGKESQ